MPKHLSISHVYDAASIQEDATLVYEVTALDDVPLAVNQLVIKQEQSVTAVPQILLLPRGVDLQEKSSAMQVQRGPLKVLEAGLVPGDRLAVAFSLIDRLRNAAHGLQRQIHGVAGVGYVQFTDVKLLVFGGKRLGTVYLIF